MNVFIFDGDRSREALLRKHLLAWGFTVGSARSFEETLACFERGLPQILILGKTRSMKERLEVCRRVRRQGAKNQQVILWFLEKPSDPQMLKALEAGVDDFLFNPLHLADLRAKLNAGAKILELQSELNLRLEKLEESNHLIRKTNEQMRRDVFAVAKIQASLLPASLPTFPNVDFAWVYKPREELAGDGLNVFRLDEDHVAFHVLDVSGRGTPAALLSVSLSREISPFPSQSTLLKRLKNSPPGYEISAPGEVLQALNGTFPLDVDTQQFFTIFYGILNLRTLELKYALAGHPCPYLLSRQGVALLPGGGVPIGFVDGAVYAEETVTLAPGDRLFVYSDGISEAMNERNILFAHGGLAQAIRQTHGRSLREAIAGLLNEAEKWAQPSGLHDDVSILACEVRERKGN